jgi:hypothetical protein
MPPKGSPKQPPPPDTVWTSNGLPGDIQRQLCVVQASQTGDITHVAAAAVLDDKTDVLIMSSDRSKSFEEIAGYYGSVTKGASSVPDRIRVRPIVLPQKDGQKGRDIKLYNMITDDTENKRVRVYDIKDRVEALLDKTGVCMTHAHT